jgi:hypothetical protein
VRSSLLTLSGDTSLTSQANITCQVQGLKPKVRSSYGTAHWIQRAQPRTSSGRHSSPGVSVTTCRFSLMKKCPILIPRVVNG